MDFVSWLLAIIGIGSDRAMHRNDKRAEVARLNAEVAGEVGRTLDILSLATPRLKRLASQIAAEHPEIHLSIVANFGKMVRNNQHCIEHPRPTQRIELHDYRITATRELLEPSIAVVHDETPVDLTPVDQFMHFFNEQALAGTELLMVFLAGHHLAPLGQFQIGVGEVPEEQRRDGVRFGYLINFNGKPQRLG